MAEKTLHGALELRPNYSRTFYNLGLINFIKGEVTDSEQAYKKALEYVNKATLSYQRNPKLKLLKAKILIKLGESELALKEVESAIKIGLEGELLEEAESIIRVNEQSGNNNPSSDTGK